MDHQNGTEQMTQNILSKIFDNLFYYYYVFYKNVLRDDIPFFTAIFAVGASTGFIVVTLADTLLVLLDNSSLSFWASLTVAVIIFATTTLYYTYKKRAQRLMTKMKWNRFNSLLVLLYFIFSLLCMVLGSELTRYLEFGY